MDLVVDQEVCYEQMAIVQKYETVINYCYPIAQNMARKHGVVRDMFIRALLGQVELFDQAGKSNQISKVYAADAGLTNLRFWFRFISGNKLRGMTIHQYQVALTMLAEVGAMVGGWIKRVKRKGQHG